MTARMKQLEATCVSHAIWRAKERYGLDLTMVDIGRLEQQCRDGSALLTMRLPGGSEHRLVRHGGRTLRAVWVPGTGRIVTFVPMNARAWDLRGAKQVPKAPGNGRKSRNGRAKHGHGRPRHEPEAEVDAE